MLTPRFKIDQDDTFIIITIFAPFTNLSETEIFMDERDFRFFSKPYFLRLYLPAEIEETDAASGAYDADTCSFVVKAPKKHPGERFEGLELLTELLKPKGLSHVSEKIEVLSESKTNVVEGDEEDLEDDEEFYYEQKLPEEVEDPSRAGQKSVSSEYTYGFGFKRHDVFKSLLEECQEILDIKNPDSLSWEERRIARLRKEKEDFSGDHYLCDLFESHETGLDMIIDWKSPWQKDTNEDDLELTKEEREVLIGLPRLDTSFDKEIQQSVYFGLIDILFGFLYDLRVTEGEHSSESGWTVSKLSCTLSCCEKFDSLKDVIVACIRRSCIYPLFRSWKLSKAVLQDVVHLIALGPLAIVKALISLRNIFAESDGRYIFNEIYINQYIAWVQSLKPSKLHSLSKSLSSMEHSLSKSDLSLELEELESAARHVSKDQDQLDSDDDSSSGTSDSSSSSSSCSSDESSDSESEEDEVAHVQAALEKVSLVLDTSKKCVVSNTLNESLIEVIPEPIAQERKEPSEKEVVKGDSQDHENEESLSKTLNSVSLSS